MEKWKCGGCAFCVGMFGSCPPPCFSPCAVQTQITVWSISVGSSQNVVRTLQLCAHTSAAIAIAPPFATHADSPAHNDSLPQIHTLSLNYTPTNAD